MTAWEAAAIGAVSLALAVPVNMLLIAADKRRAARWRKLNNDIASVRSKLRYASILEARMASLLSEANAYGAAGHPETASQRLSEFERVRETLNAFCREDLASMKKDCEATR